MKSIIALGFTLLCICCSHQSFGQWGFTLSEGIITPSEIRGFSEPTVSRYKSFPYTISGAALISVHYHITDRFATGVSFGLDNQTGDISYGPTDHLSGWNPATPGKIGVGGKYKRKEYTVAGEARWVYAVRERDGRENITTEVYGLVGAGVTFGTEKYQVYDRQDFLTLYHPYGNMPVNPYVRHTTSFTGQFTPVGIRRGGKFGCFFEFGYGYKGVFCVGFNYKPDAGNGSRYNRNKWWKAY